jgi:hypothetical protein
MVHINFDKLFTYICYFPQSRMKQKKIFFIVIDNSNKKIYHYNFVTLGV